MEPLFDAITYGLIALSVWCAIIAINDFRIMRIIKKRRGSVRKTDKVEFWSLLAMIATAIVVLFIHPGLIYKIPSVVACLEVGSVVLLYYLSDVQYHHFRKLNAPKT